MQMSPAEHMGQRQEAGQPCEAGLGLPLCLLMSAAAHDGRDSVFHAAWGGGWGPHACHSTPPAPQAGGAPGALSSGGAGTVAGRKERKSPFLLQTFHAFRALGFMALPPPGLRRPLCSLSLTTLGFALNASRKCPPRSGLWVFVPAVPSSQNPSLYTLRYQCSRHL